ncbi:hypothetical protein [Actinomyces mediterranea]|uniref:hypothetical protein n=1 Tax=Actinomyces mediterranea TaxID=1871028 RepID=UPI000970DC55|nr:hypothetical protein [Actinomyces mediterranea]
MDSLTRFAIVALLSIRDSFIAPHDNSERGDVPGWVLITLMTAALVVLIWGVASQRLVEVFNRAIDSLSGI